jgi:hypothetical protein
MWVTKFHPIQNNGQTYKIMFAINNYDENDIINNNNKTKQ